MSDKIDLFRRNGLISADGQIGGVLNPPLASRLPAMQAELKPLIKEAQRRKVMLRLGVLQHTNSDAVLVYALDVGGPHDTHGFVRRLATILDRHGVKPLEEDLGSDIVFDLMNHLVLTSQI